MKSSLESSSSFFVIVAARETIEEARAKLRLRYTASEAFRSVVSGDGRCLLGFQGSARYAEHCLLREYGNGDAGLFDGVHYDGHAVRADPCLLQSAALSRDASMMNGMCCAVSYSEISKTLCAATDYFASIPFYYSLQADAFYASNSLPRLLELLPTDRRQWNARSVAQLLCYSVVLGEETLYEGVSALPPAAYLEVTEGFAAAVRNYHEPDFGCERGRSSIGDAVESFVHAVRKTAALGEGRELLTLSGGLDSRSILAAYMHEKLPLRTASHFLQEGHDITIARRIARDLAIPHFEVPVGGDFATRLPEYANAFLAATGGAGALHNAHSLYLYECYAARADFEVDGITSFVESRSFLRNAIFRVRTQDDFFDAVWNALAAGSSLPLLRKDVVPALVGEARAALGAVLPDLKDFRHPADAADYFYVTHLNPRKIADLSVFQNHRIRFVTPYFEREYNASMRRIHHFERWKQAPQMAVIRACCPRLLRYPRAYSDVKVPCNAPVIIQKLPLLAERMLHTVGAKCRLPGLYRALSLRRPCTSYAQLIPDVWDVLAPKRDNIEYAYFDEALFRNLFSNEDTDAGRRALLFDRSHIVYTLSGNMHDSY